MINISFSFVPFVIKLVKRKQTDSMKTHVNLYIGSKIRDHRKMIKSLTESRLPMGFYIVCFIDGGNRLNILSALLFAQRYYKDMDCEIVALVNSKEEAFEYVRGLSEISVRKFGEFDARRVIDSLNGRELESLRTQYEESEKEEWLS